MEGYEPKTDALSAQEKIDLAKLWKGKRIAYVDDHQDESDLVHELFTSVLHLGIVESSTQLKEKPDSIVLHEFTNPASFLERAHDFHVAILDGQFGYGEMLGPNVAIQARLMNPELIIVGRSAEPRYNNRFERDGATDLVISKRKSFPDCFPALARVIIPREEELEDY